MSLVTDTFHEKKLNRYNINIKTKYIVKDKILERNSDGSSNDDIKQGIRIEKNYYVNKELKHTEKIFDSRIEYTFISKENENQEYKCPNCGHQDILKNFENGCPYCRTKYNVDYTDKDLGSKYHYDLVLRSTKYRLITGIIDLVISLLLAYLFIKTTSRTFNNIDVIKIFVYGSILALILYYFFYVADAKLILGPIRRYKEKENNKQKKFWNRTNIDKKTFFNNFNYEVRKQNYSQEDIIDYDIIDYIEFKDSMKNNQQRVNVTVDERIVYFRNNKIVPKMETKSYTLIHKSNETTKLTDGSNMIKCPHCGASIDVTVGHCDYCHKEINYLQEWVIE